MKRLFFGLIALFALSACVTGGDDLGLGDNTTTIGISLEHTRTSLGEKMNGSYPVYWSEGDKIAVNGKESAEATICGDNKSYAEFKFDTSIAAPFYITYPYTASSTAEQPKVEFPAEQHYTEGTFDTASAPMCAYATKQSNIQLSHLAGILRLPVKASREGVVLEKVVVTSTSNASLSGIFNVDCTTATLTPNEECSNVVTYTLPDSFALSTSTDTLLYVSLPAGISGKCTIEFVEASGKKMTAQWSLKEPLKRGVVREFKSITYKEGVYSELTPMAAEEEELLIRYKTIFGYVKDTNGNPIKDVPVTDGFTIVTTNNEGYYTMDVSNDTWYIYITLPSEYEVPIDENGQACLWKRYPSSSPRFDFTLTPLANGKEEKFALFAFGDPQVSNDTNLARFYNEAVPAIKARYDEMSKEIPCYGITLGDIISNGTTANRGHLRVPMRDGFTVQNVGLPVFHVMGNHDCNFYNASKPIFSDERNSTYQIKVQREYEDVFGPANFSFNRGDVHIIGMRNIIYVSHLEQSVKLGFMEEQYEWLKQDLALVPKDHTVLFCVHIPMMSNTTLYKVPEVLALLNNHPKTHIISGHRHFVWNYDYAAAGTPYTNLKETVCGAVCGSWWQTNLCGCGAPCGYGVFISEGKDITDSYHIGIHEGMNTRSHQMRLYRGNAICGAAIPEGSANKNGTLGYYAFNFDDDILLANVYFASNEWTIKVYEDDVYSGEMTLLPMVRRPTLANFAGDGSWESPFISKSTISHDMYVVGLMLGVDGRADNASGSRDECYHMYKYKLKNKDARIRVEATDQFGNVYTETHITEGTDYSITKAK